MLQSGKSAAVYACAQEQGFKVVEVYHYLKVYFWIFMFFIDNLLVSWVCSSLIYNDVMWSYISSWYDSSNIPLSHFRIKYIRNETRYLQVI